MKLFHGTDKCFESPSLKDARENTDFGKGFYLTEKESVANDWVKDRSTRNVNVYELTLENTSTCKLHIKRFDVSADWAKFVYNNREGLIKSNKFDIIIGPIADNGLLKLLDEIKQKKSTFEDVAFKMKMKRFNALQYCFKTEKAIKLLEYASTK